MLRKEDILKVMKELNLPVNEYWISSGAALVLHGVKDETNDIDLGCAANFWKYLLKDGSTYRIEKDSSNIMTINETIEIIKEWFVDEIEFIDGLPVASLKSIKKQKAELGREKDIKDIEKIDAYINSM